jgi:hypothetical protein
MVIERYSLEAVLPQMLQMYEDAMEAPQTDRAVTQMSPAGALITAVRPPAQQSSSPFLG